MSPLTMKLSRTFGVLAVLGLGLASTAQATELTYEPFDLKTVNTNGDKKVCRTEPGSNEIYCYTPIPGVSKILLHEAAADALSGVALETLNAKQQQAVQSVSFIPASTLKAVTESFDTLDLRNIAIDKPRTVIFVDSSGPTPVIDIRIPYVATLAFNGYLGASSVHLEGEIRYTGTEADVHRELRYSDAKNNDLADYIGEYARSIEKFNRVQHNWRADSTGEIEEIIQAVAIPVLSYELLLKNHGLELIDAVKASKP